MKSLQAPHLHLFRQGEFIQFMVDTHEMVADANAQGNGLSLDAPLEMLASAISQLKALYNHQYGSDLTKDIANYDNRRDESIRGIGMVLKGYSNHPDEEMKSAANLLLNHLNKYGSKIYKKSYQQETAIIAELTNRWLTESEYISAKNKLGLSDWVSMLKSDNDTFNDLYVARAGEASKAPALSMDKAMNEAARNYRELVSYIEAHAVLNTEKSYDDIIDALNNLTEDYNLVVVRRKSTTK